MLSLQQAAHAAPSLAKIAERIRLSQELLKLILPLVPAALRPGLQSGPLEDRQWCLLVHSPAVAAKVRQLVPTMQAHLRSHGHVIETLRIKVQTPQR